jgi:hypothetical protein
MSLTLRSLLANSNAVLSGIEQAALRGFSFVPNALSTETLESLEAEASVLEFELDDQIFRAGAPNQVEQNLEKSYVSVLDQRVPTAKIVAQGLVEQAKRVSKRYRMLAEWMPNEAGYQLYKDTTRRLSIHRDSAKDQYLAATITISGSAEVSMYETLDSPIDYRLENVRRIGSYMTEAGTVMFLRASGLENGVQTPHQVMPPKNGEPRLTLNLRMRPNSEVRFGAAS